jgi:hypothetical protein
MNQQYALERVNEFIFCIQKFRSNTSETVTKAEMALLPTMFPWTFGDKCPLEVLTKVSNRESITPQEYYNFMFILHEFMPEILVVANVFGHELARTNTDVKIVMEEWE